MAKDRGLPNEETDDLKIDLSDQDLIELIG